VLIGFSLAFGTTLDAHVLVLVPAVLLTAAIAASFSLLLSGLHVYFRDIRYLVQAALTAWIYLTPIIYPLRSAPHSVRWFIEANPVTGAVELFHMAIVGADHQWATTVLVSLAWLVILTAAGLMVHRRFDRVFADLL
jgi:ABC-type polysaccharide/polyol phosphate export permease